MSIDLSMLIQIDNKLHLVVYLNLLDRDKKSYRELEQFILIHLAFKYDYYINNIIETNKMIKIPENKIRQKTRSRLLQPTKTYYKHTKPI